MATSLRQPGLIATAIAAVAILAAVNWALSPENVLRWLRATLVLPALWLVLALWHGWALRSLRARAGADAAAVTPYFGSTASLVIGAVGIWQIATLSVEIWVRLGGAGADLDAERRVLGVAAGAVVVFIGNAMPKILTPFSMLPPGLAARVTAARRFVGTIAVLLGLIAILAFLAAPIDIAASLVRWTVGAGALALVGAIVWMNLGPMKPDR